MKQMTMVLRKGHLTIGLEYQRNRQLISSWELHIQLSSTQQIKKQPLEGCLFFFVKEKKDNTRRQMDFKKSKIMS